jgi:hypothetical protein
LDTTQTVATATWQERRVVKPVEAANRPAALQVAVWMAVLLVAVFVSVANYQSFQLGVDRDDSSYITLARSLLSSQGYGMINAPGAPATAKFPFGYPLLLVPSVRLFPGNTVALRIPSLIATILNIAILFWGWRWFCKNKSYWWALGIVGLYALSPMTIDHTRRVMSEPWFTTFCLVTIVLAEQFARRQPGRGWSTAMSLALIFVVFTRTIGVVLLLSVIGYLFFVRQKAFIKPFALILAQMALVLGILVVVTPIHLSDLFPSEYFKSDSHYLLVPISLPSVASSGASTSSGQANVQPAAGPVGSAASQIWNGVALGVKRHLGRDLRAVALPVGGGVREQQFADSLGLPNLPLIFGYLVSALVIAGWVRLFMHDGLSVLLIFTVLYLGAIFLWLGNTVRFMYPIQPFIFLGMLFSLEAMLSWLGSWVLKQRPLRIPDFVLLSLASLLLVLSVRGSLNLDDSRMHTGDLAVRTAWLKSNTQPSDVVMSEVPETDYLYSDRETVPLPWPVTAAGEVAGYLEKNGVDYVLVAPEIRWETYYQPRYSDRIAEILPLLEELKTQNLVELTYSDDESLVKVFRVHRPEKGAAG